MAREWPPGEENERPGCGHGTLAAAGAAAAAPGSPPEVHPQVHRSDGSRMNRYTVSLEISGYHARGYRACRGDCMQTKKQREIQKKSVLE